MVDRVTNINGMVVVMNKMKQQNWRKLQSALTETTKKYLVLTDAVFLPDMT